MERNSLYETAFFDIMICIFLGMALFKWGVLTGERPVNFYWLMLLICFPIGIAIAIWKNSTWTSLHFDTTRIYFSWLLPVYQVRRVFLAMGYLSVIMLLYKYSVAKNFLKATSRVGQMAFTNYLSQSIICAFIFYGFGLGLFGKLQRYQEYYVVGAIWIFQIIFSNIWLYYFQFGPFEWLWRSLTYWKKQSMKRTKAVEQKVVPALA